jgi:dynein heavy chain 2
MAKRKKITYESPPGVKKNLLRTYGGWTQPLLASGGSMGARVLFILSWLHALLQERRTYIPQVQP